MTMSTHWLLCAAIAIFSSLSQAQSVTSATSTSTSRSGPLLTGSCSVSFKTFTSGTAYFSTDYNATITSGDLVYSTALPSFSPYPITYIYSTLGCLANQTACCPFSVAAPSVDSANSTSTPLASLSPDPTLSSCPADYSTTYYTPTSTETSDQALCCPTGWGVYDLPIPAADAGDTNPCFSSVPLKYERNGQPFNTTLSDGNNTSVLIWAVFTRSYLVQAEIDSGAGTGNGGTKRIVEITVPVLVTVVLILCLGLGYRWRKKQQQHQKKRDLETEKQGMGTEKLGMPELGEGLRHKIEGRSLGATADKEQDIEISELDSNIPLQESKNKIAGVELDSRDIREMAANVPAAHEVGATDGN